MTIQSPRPFGLALCLCLMWCLFAAPFTIDAQGLSFVLTDLGSDSDVSSQANDLNDHGVVTGSYQLNLSGTNYTRGFTFNDGVRTDDYESSYPQLRSAVLGINSAGCAVGWRQATDLAPIHLEWWKAAPTCLHNTTISLVSLGGSNTSGYAINTADQVVGVSEDSSGEYHAFELTIGVAGITDLGTLAGGWGSIAADVNEDGESVGYSSSTDSVQRATLWSGGTPQDLGAFPGSTSSTKSYALGINNLPSPEVVGWSYGPTAVGHPHAFIWHNGAMVDLGTLPGGDWSEAFDINDFGDVVGWGRGSDFIVYAVLWVDGQIIDLNTVTDLPPGWSLAEARAINNRGQIVGRGVYLGADRAFLLTPVLFRDGFENGNFQGWNVVIP